MTRLCACALVLLLSGCASVPVAVVTGALGVAAGVLRVDDDVLQLWMQARGIGACRVAVPGTPGR